MKNPWFSQYFLSKIKKNVDILLLIEILPNLLNECKLNAGKRPEI